QKPADFRIFYVSDGTAVAEAIHKKLSGGDRYNLVVDLYDLQRHSTSGSSGSLQPTSPLPPAHITVLVVTPSMIEFLKGLDDNDREIALIKENGEKPLVALSFHVEIEVVQSFIPSVFQDMQCFHIEAIGKQSNSFGPCIIALISFLEQQQEPMPVPTLKKCRLVPATPVLAGDTIHILLETNLVSSLEIGSLSLSFDNGFQLTIRRSVDGRYEFQAPECHLNKLQVDIFSACGQTIGTEIIMYKDKMDILSSLLEDIVNPNEFLAQSLHLNETSSEAVDKFLSEMFSKADLSIWPKKIDIDIDATIKANYLDRHSCAKSPQEMPTILHLAAKYNLLMLAETLSMQPFSFHALQIKNKDGLTPEKLALKYEHLQMADFLEAFYEIRKMSYESTKSKEGTTPKETEEDQGCAQGSTESDYMTMTALQLSSVPKHSYDKFLPKPATSPTIVGSIKHGRYHSLDSSDKTMEEINVSQPLNMPTRSRKGRESPESPGVSTVARAVTPPRLEQTLKVFVSQQIEEVDQQIQPGTYIKGKSVQKGNKPMPSRCRRSSVSTAQFYSPRSIPLKASQSLQALNEISLTEEVVPPLPRRSKKSPVSPVQPPPLPLTLPPPLPSTLPPPFPSITPPQARFPINCHSPPPPLPAKFPLLPPTQSQPMNVYFDANKDNGDHIYDRISVVESDLVKSTVDDQSCLRTKTSNGKQSFRRIVCVDNPNQQSSVVQASVIIPIPPLSISPGTSTSTLISSEISPTSTPVSPTITSTPVSPTVTSTPASPTSPLPEQQSKSPSIFSTIFKISRSKSKLHRASKDQTTKM
ncbi:phosphoinositide 3-kinase adapter protein 1, partial [Biomphalaria glabrata]